uniref:Uncharacterized protein LOC105128816 isoform X1 n=1 Tax=Rhizophora mucronata TaxID=61149 RepID=A0A2P2JL62_RHIMU
MASSFDRWEKDPFFSAAEEVQESADRMESTYRTWIHAKKYSSSMWNCEELRRDLRTALGTTRWQLEEFQRAVSLTYIKSASDDARDRHREFILAIEDHISRVENLINESANSEGNTPLPWVCLDEGESNELALFLSGPSVFGDNTSQKNLKGDNKKPQEIGKALVPDCPKNITQSIERDSLESREEKIHGHRRTASASADIGAWNIAISEGSCPLNSSNGQAIRPPRKIPSLSGILGSIESTYNFKWPKNGVRKWKLADRQKESDTGPLQSLQLTRGINECYERSKSCLDSYDDYYDKQLYSWYGAIQRQLQRSQYQMQYSRPIRTIFSIVFLLCLIVLVALCAS